MAWKSFLQSALGVNTQVLFFAILVAWILVGHSSVLIYGLSFAVHLVNLHAYLWRHTRVNELIAQSIMWRCVAWAFILALLVPTIPFGINAWALIVLLMGTLLHAAAVNAIGIRRTYYSVELAEDQPKSIQTFPYNGIPHPMALGSILQFLGVWFLTPDFQNQHAVLMVGHILFTLLTLVIEHFDVHFSDYFFPAVKGRFSAKEAEHTIDGICKWSLERFESDINAECSMHRYIKTLPEAMRCQIDDVRYAEPVMRAIQAAFPTSKIVPLPMTDEIYISRYNLDRGGDQGLFDKHHDGNLRFMPGASVVRSLVYLSSEDDLAVVFETTGLRAEMKTYDFGLLDFHKELHWVDGSYDPSKPPRILLKCNYYVDHFGFPPYRWVGICANIAVFYVVKAAMEFSKSPKSLSQRIVGYLCNLFRSLNNLNPAAPIVLVAVVLAVSTRLLLRQMGLVF